MKSQVATAWVLALGLFVAVAGGKSANTAPYVITVDDADLVDADQATPVVYSALAITHVIVQVPVPWQASLAITFTGYITNRVCHAGVPAQARPTLCG